MSIPSRNLLPLWDYGWCDHHRVLLSRCHSAEDVIREYVRSDAFGTSFVGRELDSDPELHGPFIRSKVSVADFELVSPQQFLDEVASIRQPDGFDSVASDDQWHPVRRLADEIIGRCPWIIRLRLTEKDKDRFHDWGFVLWVFREFICAGPDTDSVERLVFGYD